MPAKNAGEVSVVIVNYNSGVYLERCLRSLLRSDIGLEICIVDNQSTDDSLDKLQLLDKQLAHSFHALQVIRNSDNLGFSAAVNIGAAATSAPHIFVLNPDCYVHAHTARALRDALVSNTDGGMVGALVFNEDGTEQSGCRRNEPTLLRSAVKTLGLSRWFEGVDLRLQLLPDMTYSVDAVSGSAMLFCRHRFNEIHGMDEQYFLHCEDLDVCHRMRDAGYGVYFAPEVSLFHRQGVSGGSSSREIESMKHQGMMRYYLKHYAGSNILSTLLVKFLVWSHFLVKQTIHLLKQLLIDDQIRNAELSTYSGLLPDLPGPDDPNMVIVTGGNSDVGDFFLDRMAVVGRKCIVPYRVKAASKNSPYAFWLSQEYFDKASKQDLPVFDQWVNLAPVWTSERFMRFFRHHFPKKIVALGSTSIEVKSNSSNSQEQATVSLLQEGEKVLASSAHQNDAVCVILRPTLIYGGPRNKNINLIKTVIKMLGLFPIVGEAEGKRQPVHAEDVAAACEQALHAESTRTMYSIAGAEALSFRQMIGRTFESLGRSSRFLTCPEYIARGLLMLAQVLPGLKGFSPGIIDRLQADQVFSNKQAIEDFGYSPRKFEP